jgi:hypothetical protein
MALGEPPVAQGEIEVLAQRLAQAEGRGGINRAG